MTQRAVRTGWIAVFGVVLGAPVLVRLATTAPEPLWKQLTDITGLLALSGLVVAFLFVAVALLIYQIEYMTMYVTVQLLSAAHLVLLFISFMILPNETGYLPIIVGEAVLAFACYRVYRQAWAAPEYSLFWRRALAW